MKFACPHCSGHLDAGVEIAGVEIACPHCQDTIVVPFNSQVSSPSRHDKLKRDHKKGRMIGFGAAVLVILVFVLVVVAATTKKSSRTPNSPFDGAASSVDPVVGKWVGKDGMHDEITFFQGGGIKATFFASGSGESPVPLTTDRGSWGTTGEDSFYFGVSGESTAFRIEGDTLVMQQPHGTSSHYVRAPEPLPQQLSPEVLKARNAAMTTAGQLADKIIHAVSSYQQKHNGSLSKDWAALVPEYKPNDNPYAPTSIAPHPLSVNGIGMCYRMENGDLNGPLMGKLLELLSKDEEFLSEGDLVQMREISCSLALDGNADGEVSYEGRNFKGGAVVAAVVHVIGMSDDEIVFRVVE